MNEQTHSTKKVRRSRADIEKILDDYRQSGLTQVAYAKEHGLNLGTFRSWVAKRREGPAKGLCPVNIRQELGEATTIRLPGGIEVAIHGTIDPRWVIALIRGLDQ